MYFKVVDSEDGDLIWIGYTNFKTAGVDKIDAGCYDITHFGQTRSLSEASFILDECYSSGSYTIGIRRKKYIKISEDEFLLMRVE